MRVQTREGRTLLVPSARGLRALVGVAGTPCCCGPAPIDAYLAVDCCGVGLVIAIEPAVVDRCGGFGGVFRLDVGLDPWRGRCFTITRERPTRQPERIYRWIEVTCSDEGCGGENANAVCPRCVECCLLVSVRPCGREDEIPPPESWDCCVMGNAVELRQRWEIVVERYEPVIVFAACSGDPPDDPPCSTRGQLRVARPTALSYRAVKTEERTTTFAMETGEDGGACFPTVSNCSYDFRLVETFDQWQATGDACDGSLGAEPVRQGTATSEQRTTDCYDPPWAHVWEPPHLWGPLIVLGDGGSTVLIERPELMSQMSNPCAFNVYAEECWYRNFACPVDPVTACQGVRVIEAMSGSGRENCGGGTQDQVFERWETPGQGRAWDIPAADAGGARVADHVYYTRVTLRRTWTWTVLDRTLCRRDACNSGERPLGLRAADGGVVGTIPLGVPELGVGLAGLGSRTVRRGTGAAGAGCGGCRKEAGL